MNCLVILFDKLCQKILPLFEKNINLNHNIIINSKTCLYQGISNMNLILLLALYDVISQRYTQIKIFFILTNVTLVDPTLVE